MNLIGHVVILSLLLFAVPARSEISAGLFATTLSDEMSTTPASSETKTYIAGVFQISVDSKKSLYFGWSYSSFNSDSSHANVTERFTSNDTGPCFTYFFGPKQSLILAGGFNVIAKASYEKTATTLTEFQGTSFWVAPGAELELTKQILLGGRLFYSSANYGDQKIGASATSINISRTLMLPMLTITYRN